MKFVNLSQHKLGILNPLQPTKEFTFRGRQQLALDAEPHLVISLPPWEGALPEVVRTSGDEREVDGVSILFEGTEEIKNLPSPQEGTIFITSYQAAKAAWSLGRKDICCPGQLVFVEPHQGRGEIAGCLGLKGSK